MQYSRILLFIHSKCNSLHLPTPTEKAMATHSSTLAWTIPWAEEPGRLQSDTTERLHFHFPFPLSCIGEGNGNPIQCSCLENPRDGGAWWAAIYGVAQSLTRLKRLSSSSSSQLQIPSPSLFSSSSLLATTSLISMSLSLFLFQR